MKTEHKTVSSGLGDNPCAKMKMIGSAMMLAFTFDVNADV